MKSTTAALLITTLLCLQGLPIGCTAPNQVPPPPRFTASPPRAVADGPEELPPSLPVATLEEEAVPAPVLEQVVDPVVESLVEPAAEPAIEPVLEPEAEPVFTWPEPPTVALEWEPRGKRPATRLEFMIEGWTEADGRRSTRLTHRHDEVAFMVWLEQIEGVDATRVTVGAINGFQNAGPRYFKRYAIEIDGVLREEINGRHVILPRGALLRRFFSGPEQRIVSEWRYVRDDRPSPSWATPLAARDTAKRLAFPFRDLSGRPVDLGPYNFFWNNKSLSDSHGGWGIGPFHGGPDDWLTSSTGRKNRATEMLLAFQRPIWLLADDFSALVLQVPYWMGRTDLHELPGYHYELDNWCPYAERLSKYKFADYTHLSRGTAGAAAVAPWDRFAVDCLLAVFADFETSESLVRVVGEDAQGYERLHPGVLQVNSLLYPLWKKIDLAKGPSGTGDRGLAHWLRLVRWCRPYLPPEKSETYDNALRKLVRGLADAYGVTLGRGSPKWASDPEGELTVPMEDPFCLTFQQQLVAYECLRFGGLDSIAKKCFRFLTPQPPEVFEVRAGQPGDTVLDRNHSADVRQKKPRWAYAAYGHFTHNRLIGYQSISAFLSKMESQGVNGSSQDMDNTPREIWEGRVR